MALNVVMLGPPGAGKGTAVRTIRQEPRAAKIATGDILREAVMAGTPMGRVAKATMDAGELVGDDVMIGIVGDRLKRPDTTAGFRARRVSADRHAGDGARRDHEGPRPLLVIDIEVPETCSCAGSPRGASAAAAASTRRSNGHRVRAVRRGARPPHGTTATGSWRGG